MNPESPISIEDDINALHCRDPQNYIAPQMTIREIIEKLQSLNVNNSTTLKNLIELLGTDPRQIYYCSYAIVLAANQDGKIYIKENQGNLPLMALLNISPEESQKFWGDNLNQPWGILYRIFKDQFIKAHGKLPDISIKEIHSILIERSNTIFGFDISKKDDIINHLQFFYTNLEHFHYLLNRIKVKVNGSTQSLRFCLLKNNYSKIEEQLGDDVNKNLSAFPIIWPSKEELNSIVLSSKSLYIAAKTAGMTNGAFLMFFNTSGFSAFFITDDNSYIKYREYLIALTKNNTAVITETSSEEVNRELNRTSGEKTHRPGYLEFFPNHNHRKQKIKEIETPKTPVTWDYNPR